MDRTPDTLSSSTNRALRRLVVPAIILLGLLLVAASFLVDAAVTPSILAANHGHWDHSRIVALCSQYGDWPELMILGLLGYVLARWLRNVRWQKILLAAMIASTLSGMTANALRLTTGRTRPRAVAEQGWYGPKHGDQWLIGQADFNSFPSGHTATAFGFAGVLLFASPLWGLPAMLVAAAIALSRLLLGAHHPSDIVIAAAMALAIAWWVWKKSRSRRSPQEGSC